MRTATKPSCMQTVSKLMLIALCVLCMQALGGCAGKSGEEGIVDQAVRYAKARTLLDLSTASVASTTPGVEVEISFMGVEDAPDGTRAIELEPAVVSDTMASWSADEWAQNRDDLFFHFAAHFKVVCNQAHDYSDLPQNYTLTCPDYMVVYDSAHKDGFIVSSTGVYYKTDDPEHPRGEAIIQVDNK